MHEENIILVYFSVFCETPTHLFLFQLRFLLHAFAINCICRGCVALEGLAAKINTE